MDSKIYIKNKLNEISEIFPELIFRYQFDKSSMTHIIEVKPLESYQSNEAYVQCEADFMFDFENKFFPETILFVSEDSLTQITEPEFTIRKQIFVSSPLKAKYSFALEMAELFCVVSEDNYVFAA
jgi:hypothetical protein